MSANTSVPEEVITAEDPAVEEVTSDPAVEEVTSDPAVEATVAPETTPTTTTSDTTTTETPATTTEPTAVVEQDAATTESTTSSTSTPEDTTIIIETTDSAGSISTLVITATRTPTLTVTGTSSSEPSSSTGAITGDSDSSSGLSTGGKIAIAVVVPIACVALFFIVGLYFWRKRRARREEEDQRKQDLKDYAYNPNDPSLPPIAGAGDSYEMKEDQPAGYRGWGTSTLASSVGRHASTTMSGGGAAGQQQAYSDMTTLISAHATDTRSGDPATSDGANHPEGEILGAMGPPASQNRGGGDIRRGPSNASSRYSLGAGSEESDGRGIGVAYSGGPTGHPQPPRPVHQPEPTGYENYVGGNPYADNPYAFAPAPPPGRQTGPQPGPTEISGPPVIRDNPSRRTAQIQNANPHVQQPGISQNF